MWDFQTRSRLVTNLLLTTTLLAMGTVDAFSSSLLLYQERSLSSNCRHCSERMALFGRKDRNMVEFVGDNGEAIKSYKSRKRKGIIRRDVKKLNWLSTPKSRRSYMKKKTKDYGFKKYNWRKEGIRQRIVYRWRGFRQKLRYLLFRNTVYVLECEHGKYYVGSTKNKKMRYYQHFQGKRSGSKWTKQHKPIRVLAEHNRIPSRYVLGMESQKTAEYMMKFGVNNVRGAAFCGVREFTTNDISDLTGFLGHYNQLNYGDLHKELWRVLPRAEATKAYSRPQARVYKAPEEATSAARVYNATKETNYTSKTTVTSELPKAVVRSKLRKSKRKDRKKRRAAERKNCKPSDDDEDDDHNDFKNRVDWTIEN